MQVKLENTTFTIGANKQECFETYATIKFQDGVIPENGINGVQVDDVLEVALLRLMQLNHIKPCRENSIAITKVEEALMWLEKRTKNRELRGVEETNLD